MGLFIKDVFLRERIKEKVYVFVGEIVIYVLVYFCDNGIKGFLVDYVLFVGLGAV